MKRRPKLLNLFYNSIYLLLNCVVLMITVGAIHFFYLAPRFLEDSSLPAATAHAYRRAVLPPSRPTGSESSNGAIPARQNAGASAGIQGQTIGFVDPPGSTIVSDPTSKVFGAHRAWRATSTPTPEGILSGLARGVERVFGAVDSGPVKQFGLLLTLTPTPTGTATPIPSPTPSPTETATATTPPTATDTSTPTVAPTQTNTPVPTATPLPPPPSLPTATPPPTATPLPQYDFMLAEFYNSPTTNSFLLAYVAIVDAKEIPIGDMKVVGTRLDHDLTYESLPSTWFFEGYSAPGEVIKSGNVKFEPPGGIETSSWVLYLADAQGNRMSADVPFDVDQNDKQWYFIKFRRNY